MAIEPAAVFFFLSKEFGANWHCCSKGIFHLQPTLGCAAAQQAGESSPPWYRLLLPSPALICRTIVWGLFPG